MRLSEKEELQLHRWSCLELESIGQSSPELLAKIIVASVKEDKTTTALKAHCISQLKTFLKEYTDDFVEVLFQAIEGGCNHNIRFLAQDGSCSTKLLCYSRWIISG
jgi:hypothetical protein